MKKSHFSNETAKRDYIITLKGSDVGDCEKKFVVSDYNAEKAFIRALKSTKYKKDKILSYCHIERIM